MNRYTLILILIMLGLLASLYGPTLLHLSATEQRTLQQQGDVIVKQVHAFHLAQGRYPSELAELVPGYLREADLKYDGVRWQIQNDADGFVLLINRSRRGGQTRFVSRYNKWFIDESF